nr:hypothetical protein [Priestia endophytica]
MGDKGPGISLFSLLCRILYIVELASFLPSSNIKRVHKNRRVYACTLLLLKIYHNLYYKDPSCRKKESHIQKIREANKQNIQLSNDTNGFLTSPINDKTAVIHKDIKRYTNKYIMLNFLGFLFKIICDGVPNIK